MADEHPDIGSPTPEDHTTVEKRLAHSLSLLRATFDSTADGILVADGQGRIETFNQRFVQLWQLPADVLAGGDDNAALAFVLDQLIDPEGFLAKVNDLYANPDAESFDVLHFKDGRVFERYSRPQRMGNLVVGRVWSFRDVTGREQAATELAEEVLRRRALFDQSRDGIVVIDMNGGALECNARFAEMLGSTVAKVSRMHLGLGCHHVRRRHPPALSQRAACTAPVPHAPPSQRRLDIRRRDLVRHAVLERPAAVPVHGARHHRPPARRGRAAAAPGTASPGPEDGCHRPTDRWHRARVQQHARRDPRLRLAGRRDRRRKGRHRAGRLCGRHAARGRERPRPRGQAAGLRSKETGSDARPRTRPTCCRVHCACCDRRCPRA
ncbi:MAG: PAS domain-containing protein [bacterium]|nr:PAS domain-containing protein [bacterium]